MAFESNMPVDFDARSGQPYRDATIMLEYRASPDDDPPWAVRIDRVFRDGCWDELSPEWWSIDYMGSEGNVHRLRLVFFGNAFSASLSRGFPRAVELDNAFRDYATIVIDLNLAPQHRADDRSPREIAALHLKLV